MRSRCAYAVAREGGETVVEWRGKILVRLVQCHQQCPAHMKALGDVDARPIT
jgi:hypothetical protein